MPRSRISFRALTVGSFVIAAIVAACQSDNVTGPDQSGITKIPSSPVNVSAFLCKAQPKTLSLNCTSADDPTLPSYLIGIDPSTEPSNILIGGQHSNVDIVSSNVTNNTTTHQFAFDVTVKNLRPRAIGTIDELATDSSLKVAFVSGPTTTAGSGNVTVANATGTDFFTAGGQPYFKYGQMLAQNQVSPAKNWVLQYDATVSSFSFLLLVNASVKYPFGYIDVFAPSDSVFAGGTLQMQDSVRDPLGVATADQSETWTLSSSADSAKASINASGLLTATAAGNVTVVATQAAKTGSKVIKIKAPAAKLAVITHSTTPAQSGVVFAQQPVIQLKDAGNSNVTLGGVVIHAAITSGGGTLGGTDSAATNANGAATFSGLKITGTAGPKVITFTSGALTSVADSITLTAGPAANIVVAAGSTGVAAGSGVTVTANVTDASANPVNGVSVAWTQTSSGAAGTFSPSASTSTNASGVATVTFNTANTAGLNYTVIGTIAGPKADTTDVIQTQAPPSAVADSSAANSSPGATYHAAFNTLLNITAGSGLLANDNRGTPAANVTSFGLDSLGGAITDHAAGTTVSPLPGHANGSLTVNADGSVAFTPPTGFTGYYVFHYQISNTVGGVPQNSNAVVKIAVGIRPSASNSTYGTTLLGNVGINTSTSTNTKVTAAGDAITYNNVGATNGTGTVHSDGTYDFKPSVGFISGNGTLTFSVKNGFGTTANATVTLPVGATRVWFVTAGGAAGDGRFGTPFNCFVGASGCLSGATLGAGDIVQLGTGTYSNTASLTLLNNMRIIGQGLTGNFADAANANVTWPLDAGAQPAINGVRPVVNSAGTSVFTLGAGNTLRGIQFGSTSGVTVTGAAVGTLTINNAAIVNPTGRAIDLSTSGTVSIALDSIIATGGTGNGINLVSQAGTFTSAVTKITNPSGTAINVTGSSGFSFGTTTVKKIGSSGTGINLATNSGTTTFTALVDSTTSGSALVASSAGTLSIGGGTISAIAGSAVDAASTAFSGAGFTSVSSTGGTNGVSLNGVTGTVALGSGSLAGGTGFNQLGGTSATVTFSGTVTGSSRPVSISNAAGAACGTVTLSGKVTGAANGILVQNCNAGTITFSGPDTLSTTTNTAVQLASNTGTVINFTGGATGITTTTGNGFDASGGGTITVTGSNNSISSGAGVALSVQNTTVGASGLTFQSISANGGTNGIILNNTGLGALSVTGTGSAASGGTIQNVSLDGISLTDTRSPSFSRMSISNTGRSGIRGRRVKNFTLSNSTINNVGTAAAGQYEESNIAFNDLGVFTDSALTGDVSITNNTLTNARRHGIDIENGRSTITSLTITGNTLTSSTVATTSLGTAILVASQGSASTTSNVTTGSVSNNVITNFPSGEGIAILGGSGNTSNNTSGTLGASGTPFLITGNAISGGTGTQRMGSNAIRATFNGQVGVANFTISNNGTAISPITNIQGQGISVFMGGTITGTTTINNNFIVANQNLGAGTQGLAVQIDDGPAGLGTSAADYNISITNNSVSNYEGFGIRGIARASNGKLDLTIQNNTLGTPILANRSGIRVDAGSAVGDVNVCLLISGNTSKGSGVNQGIGLRKQGTVATTNDFGIVGLSPSPATAAATATYVAGQNPNGSGVDIISGDNFLGCTQTP